MKDNDNNQQRLSEHFTLSEMTRSATALDRGIKNVPSPTQVENLRELCQNVLEPLRKRFGVIRVTSGFRCPELNRAVSGARDSQHTQGEAADIHVTGREMAGKMVLYLRMVVDFDGGGLRPMHHRASGHHGGQGATAPLAAPELPQGREEQAGGAALTQERAIPASPHDKGGS